MLNANTIYTFLILTKCEYANGGECMHRFVIRVFLMNVTKRIDLSLVLILRISNRYAVIPANQLCACVRVLIYERMHLTGVQCSAYAVRKWEKMRNE